MSTIVRWTDADGKYHEASMDAEKAKKLFAKLLGKGNCRGVSIGSVIGKIDDKKTFSGGSFNNQSNRQP